MNLKNLVKFGAPLLVAAFASTAAHAAAPDYVRVRSISYAGSGCRAGTVAENVSPDLQAFTLLFDSYIASAGPGISPLEKRKNCTLNIDLDFPQGWSFTIFTVDYRGYVSLERGVNGLQTSKYYFQGQPATGTLSTPIAGPVDRDYQIRDTLGLSAEVWSPCGAQRALNINTDVRVDNTRNRRATGLMTVDSIDGQLKLIYGIKWRRC
jgi:hypothetical protein